MKPLRLALRIALPLALLAGGALGLRALLVSRQLPQREARPTPAPLVEVWTATAEARAVTVAATGTVRAAREVAVAPQVGGRVIWLAPELVAGGFFAAGAPLFELEKVDYALAVERARAGRATAAVELAKAESQARVARQEWERLGLPGPAPDPLVLHEPQLEQARATVAAAEVAVRQAEIDLSRTVVRAPFASRVRAEDLEVGQLVRQGVPAATLAGTEAAEVLVPLPPEDLAWLRVPRPGTGERGSPAVIRAPGGGPPWRGHLARSLGEVDPKTRLVQVVVLVPDPYGLAPGARANQPALAPGLFVEVEFAGRPVGAAVLVPRGALQEGPAVWVAGPGDALEMRPVAVARRERDHVLVTRGLAPGDRVVLTPLPGATDGMPVRIAPGAPPP